MKFKFKFLALVLAMIMVLSACGTLGNTNNTTQAPSTSNTESSNTESSETESQSVSESQSNETEPQETKPQETKPQETTPQETKPQETQPKETQTEYRPTISRSREEVEAMLTITDDAFTKATEQLAAFEKIALESSDIDAIDEVYLAFEDSFYFIATQTSIASVIYYLDMSNTAAYDRYNPLFEKYGDMYDSYAECCKNIYNNSPIRDEIFADWTEEEIQQMLGYSPEITELQLKNDELTNELNNLSNDVFTDRSAEIYAQLVTNNNRIAELMGYDNYYDYATKEIYLRDYSRADLEAYCNNVAQNYVDKFPGLLSKIQLMLNVMSNKDYTAWSNFTYRAFDRLDKNYVTGYISSFDGSMREGLEHVFVNKNMIFSNNPNSHPTAFQTYLDYLDMPFCLFGSEGQSSSTLIHEFGHYYASLYNSSLTSYDLAETQSQGNEMLFLCWLDGQMQANVFNAFKAYTMYANINTIISCVIIDEFEREVYALDSVEGFKSADFDAIMAKVCEKYGGVKFIEDNLGDMNGYWRQVATNNPVYYISYAISLTAAMNIYAEALENPTEAREMYRKIVEDVTEDMGFLAALEMAGLPSPFSKESNDNIMKIVWNVKPSN